MCCFSVDPQLSVCCRAADQNMDRCAASAQHQTKFLWWKILFKCCLILKLFPLDGNMKDKTWKLKVLSVLCSLRFVTVLLQVFMLFLLMWSNQEYHAEYKENEFLSGFLHVFSLSSNGAILQEKLCFVFIQQKEGRKLQLITALRNHHHPGGYTPLCNFCWYLMFLSDRRTIETQRGTKKINGRGGTVRKR